MKQLPVEMMSPEGSALIVSATCTGIAGVNGEKVGMIRDFAHSGIDPVSLASHFAGLPDEVTQKGVEAMKLVGGTEFNLGVSKTLSQFVRDSGTASHGEAVSVAPPGRNPEGGRGGRG